MRKDFDAALVEGRVRCGVRLTVRDGRIHDVEAVTPPGDGKVVLPGFCNAHVHLDLSFLRGQDLSHRSFADWVRDLVTARRGADEGRSGASVYGIDSGYRFVLLPQSQFEQT